MEYIIDRLRALGSAEARAGMARFGIDTARAFGVPVSTLRPMAREIRRDHDLAQRLWAELREEGGELGAPPDRKTQPR